MAKIGRFANDTARAEYLAMYEAAEGLWPLPVTQADIATSFGSTHVRWSGEGDGIPIVLLHGVGANGLAWHFVIEDLARDRVVYALDTIGTAGRSVQTAPLTREADFAVWVNEVLAGLGLERVHLVGYSHGAWHASLVALHDAGRLASVTLVEPGGMFTKPPWRVLLKMIRFGMGGRSDANMRKMMAWLSPGVEVTEQEFAVAKAALRYRMGIGWARVLKDAELQAITVPTLVVFGGDSLVTDAEVASRRIVENIPNGETQVYPGRGHGVFYEIPQRVAARILAFAARHEASNSAVPE
ncbi:alpha/beta fold hydrolase [Nocardia otitidiscaviarum]|uniref:alpha/beta fold hydrolase n=1 Tax=Nocardia otitidiscaviarum TaxID=1823 RepID=UPI0004A6DD23|nr:alpha/beta fold hydrolase [Nocardia otitidiscaviarum]MBF6487094.1 alpha/beta fold hydrolase [Nocardia otitidiscaviarum]